MLKIPLEFRQAVFFDDTMDTIEGTILCDNLEGRRKPWPIFTPKDEVRVCLCT